MAKRRGDLRDMYMRLKLKRVIQFCTVCAGTGRGEERCTEWWGEDVQVQKE
jgi:hypothetical protein